MGLRKGGGIYMYMRGHVSNETRTRRMTSELWSVDRQSSSE